MSLESECPSLDVVRKDSRAVRKGVTEALALQDMPQWRWRTYHISRGGLLMKACFIRRILLEELVSSFNLHAYFGDGDSLTEITDINIGSCIYTYILLTVFLLFSLVHWMLHTINKQNVANSTIQISQCIRNISHVAPLCNGGLPTNLSL